MTDGTVEQLLPLTKSDSSESPDETESRVIVADEEDSSLQHSTSSSRLISKTILSRVVLPLVLFALIAGILFMQGEEYESEEVLEDVEFKDGQIRADATMQQQHDHDFNNEASEVPAASNHDISKSWSRWKQLGNNCDADQRLANTTNLHCGIAKDGKIVVQPVIQNEQGTCGGVRLEPNYCVSPSRGEWVLWGHQSSLNETALLPPLPQRFGSYQAGNNEATTNQSLPLCNTQEDILDGNQQGSADNFDREWVPNSCDMLPLNPFAWMDHSKCQVTIVMLGDSHIRNLFTATVHGLRGSSAFAEAHAGSDVKDNGIILTYEWRIEEEEDSGDSSSNQRQRRASDHFKVHRNTNNQTDYKSLFDECPCNNNNSNSEEGIVHCLRIAFVWAPHFAEQVKQVQLVNDLQADLVIVEPGNSYETTVLSNEWTTAMEAILQQPNEHRHLAILHFPYGRQPKGRPEAIQSWINTTTNNNTATNRISYWQQGKLGFGGKQSRKTWHYACGLGRTQIRNDVIMGIEMCTDEADTSYIRAITTLHFDAFGVHSKL